LEKVAIEKARIIDKLNKKYAGTKGFENLKYEPI